jgi:biofilm PGA synthesis N-glycosyltransferase PgaC
MQQVQEPRIMVVSPVRNEAAHILAVARAVAAQQLAPARWIVVDDGSTDGTLEQLRELELEIDFLTVMQAPPHSLEDGGESPRDRLAHAIEVRNFNLALTQATATEQTPAGQTPAGQTPAGQTPTEQTRAGQTPTGREGEERENEERAAKEQSAEESFTHVMKLDGDIELPPHYLRVLMERFTQDPSLGLAGGVLVEPTADGGVRQIKIPANHIHGALKCYSRDCFAAIGGVQERLGWDTIDETYARMRGFRTLSFPDLVSIHHRPLASADGALRGHARHGECAYIAHYGPMWVTLRSFKVARRRPPVLSGAAFLYGYARAATRRVERVPDPDYRRFTRRELRTRMLGGTPRLDGP